MATEPKDNRGKRWQFDGESPFIHLLRLKHREIQKKWNIDRINRLCVLGNFTWDEVCAFVGQRCATKWHLGGKSRSTLIDMPTVLNLQRLEDYVIHRKLGVHPSIRPEDAVLVKILNRTPEQPKEAA